MEGLAKLVEARPGSALAQAAAHGTQRRTDGAARRPGSLDRQSRRLSPSLDSDRGSIPESGRSSARDDSHGQGSGIIAPLRDAAPRGLCVGLMTIPWRVR
jgi:hypothetical protein